MKRRANAKASTKRMAKKERKKTPCEDTARLWEVHFMQNSQHKDIYNIFTCVDELQWKKQNIGFLNYGQWHVCEIPGAHQSPNHPYIKWMQHHETQ